MDKRLENEMSRFEAEIAKASTRPNLISHHGGSTFLPHQITNRNYTPYVASQPAIISARPAIYSRPKPSTSTSQAPLNVTLLQSDVQTKLEKLRGKKMSAELAISQAKASSALQSYKPTKKKGPKNKDLMRSAGGSTWEDRSLADWADNDFRIFCGDLGNDVTDDVLIKTFNKYPSFQKAKVIFDKKSQKSKGYGFVSFKNSEDYVKAMKDINGQYVGSRPIKLRKSTWTQRNLKVVKKKEMEKEALKKLLMG